MNKKRTTFLVTLLTAVILYGMGKIGDHFFDGPTISEQLQTIIASQNETKVRSLKNESDVASNAKDIGENKIEIKSNTKLFMRLLK